MVAHKCTKRRSAPQQHCTSRHASSMILLPTGQDLNGGVMAGIRLGGLKLLHYRRHWPSSVGLNHHDAPEKPQPLHMCSC
jgi:hypothetical protein